MPRRNIKGRPRECDELPETVITMKSIFAAPGHKPAGQEKHRRVLRRRRTGRSHA